MYSSTIHDRLSTTPLWEVTSLQSDDNKSALFVFSVSIVLPRRKKKTICLCYDVLCCGDLISWAISYCPECTQLVVLIVFDYSFHHHDLALFVAIFL